MTRPTPQATIVMITGLLAIFAAGAAQGAPPAADHPPACAHQQPAQADGTVSKARQEFLTQTADIRRDLVSKRAELRAVMAGENPDPAQASKLAAQIFDLQERLRVKANEMGLPAGIWRNHGLAGGQHPCMDRPFSPGHHPRARL